MSEGIWGAEVVSDRYAGHPGRRYQPAPASIMEMLDGTEVWADRTFVVQDERRITHGRFRSAIPRAAHRLQAHGVGPGTRLLVYAYNSPEFMLAVCASWWLGAVPVLANRWWGATELDHAIALTKPEVVLSDSDELLRNATSASPAGGAVGITLLRAALDAALDAEVGAEVDDAETQRPVMPDIDDPALILFTSGSSGLPKAAVLSSRSVIANQHNLLARSRRLPPTADATAPQRVNLVSGPLFHIGGISNVLTNLLLGGRLVLPRGKFDPEEVLTLIETEQVQAWGGVPTMAIRVLEHPRFAAYDLTSLRSLPLGGAPVHASLLERMSVKLPQLRERGLANTWGMTESGGFVTVAGNADLKRHPGTVGRPYPTVELRISQPTADGSGEVCVRSPTVMLGYLGIDDETVDADGWLHTGDLGHLNEEGYLFLDGRSKDIVIRGGENIACAHVEQALLTHPCVIEAAVFGIPHEDLGEELAAAVRVSGRLSGEELSQHLRRTLAYFEVPTAWRISEEPLPTLPGEKPDKKAIRAAFLESR